MKLRVEDADSFISAFIERAKKLGAQIDSNKKANDFAVREQIPSDEEMNKVLSLMKEYSAKGMNTELIQAYQKVTILLRILH